MTIEKIESTGLWGTAFNEKTSNKYRVQCNRLTSELWKFREKTGLLVNAISGVLPGLTVHDLSHLDALWEVADIIAGKSYPLNPLEAFVLGGAILLHDSAMCWEAYQDGQSGVRKTVEWRDAYAVECDRSPNHDDAARRDAADFAALRLLHAHQAAKLPEREWQHPDTGAPLYLIDDPDLRIHLGKLIGSIASSHHWNIDILSSRLPEQFNAPSWIPVEWSVDPIKIACLLRCADAAHISQARAPDFMYALIRRSGISKAHWQAQNRMFGPTLDAGDLTNKSITYTSSMAYGPDAVAAWWVAFDAVNVIQFEIEASNTLLRSRNRAHSAPEFAVKEVKGAKSLEGMMRLLRVEGWIPCGAQIHVSNIERLVKNLGGEKLYGEGANKLEVVLRELIQNSRDAVAAKRHVDADYTGVVSVKIVKQEDGLWLTVEDDGVGMSYSVLTGALLDFGTSFWSSSLVQEEFPGLRSSGFKSLGQFGIGFYSVFMIAESVAISSRKWDKGLDEVHTLLFPNGLTLRPVVQRGRPQNFSARTSTAVRLKLKENVINENELMEVRSGRLGVPDLTPTLKDYLSVLVCGLDVTVTFESPASQRSTISLNQVESDIIAEQLLTNISLQPYQHESAKCLNYIMANTSRLREIRDGDKVFGLAAISTLPDSDQMRLGIRTIGGLATSVQGGYVAEYIGYVDHKPESARRDGTELSAPVDVVATWYSEQIQILKQAEFSDYERCVVATNACELGFDPFEFGRVLMISSAGQPHFISYETAASLALDAPLVIFKSIYGDHAETYCRVAVHDRYNLLRPLRNSSAYLSLELTNGVPSKAASLIGCVHRAVIAKGKTPRWNVVKSKFESSFGEMEELILTVSA